MADPQLPFHCRLRAAILVSAAPGQSFAERLENIRDHIRSQGVRGPHMTLRSFRRWLDGQGHPPAYWLKMVAAYLDVPAELISPTREEVAAARLKQQERTSKRSQQSFPVQTEIPGEWWASETVYIVGGGPSAGYHDLTQLQGIVVAVNDSAAFLPHADVVFTASPPWCRHRTQLIQKHSGILVVRTACGPSSVRRWGLPESTILLPLRKRHGTTEQERKAAHNSGQEAIYWAASQGARRIVLIGFDMGEPRHWHGGYEWMAQREVRGFTEEHYPIWIDNMVVTAQDMADVGVEITNANPCSKITAFPYQELPIPRTRPKGAPELDGRLSCVVLIPVGPGHEAYSVDAVRSVIRAWEEDPGPFSSMRLVRVMDTDGRLGRSLVRNKGLDENPADWHFLLDADDEMMPRAFGLVDLNSPATFGAVFLENGKRSKDNLWPVTLDTIRRHGAKGTLSMGCWVRGDLGIRFQDGIPVGQDYDFYMRLPDFVKLNEPLVSIGYRKPRAGGEVNREAVSWLDVCREIVTSYLGPPPKGTSPSAWRPTPLEESIPLTTVGDVP